MNLNIRFPRAMWKEYLVEMDNYSEFCRDAILQRIERENSDQYINSQIEHHQNQIKEWKQRKKQSIEDPDKVEEVLNEHYESYRNNKRIRLEDSENCFWIKNHVLPDLKAVKCTRFKSIDILEIFQEHEREGKVIIHV